MIGADLYFRDKIPVTVLGAAGEIGQELVKLLAHHPWFEMSSSGSLIFSTLQQKAMAEEKHLAEAGYSIVSCAPYDLNQGIPLIVPEVNRYLLSSTQGQQGFQGIVIANPRSLVIGVSLALKPLIQAFGLETVQLIVPQSSLSDHLEIKRQCLHVLGRLHDDRLQEASFKIDIQEHPPSRIETQDIVISVKFKRNVEEKEEIIKVWRAFGSGADRLPLPTAPYHPLYYLDSLNACSEPNSSLDNRKMSIYLRKLSPCSILDYKFHLSFDQRMRGIVGSMLLNAELLVTLGKVYW